jgi:hypothetical protein
MRGSFTVTEVWAGSISSIGREKYIQIPHHPAEQVSIGSKPPNRPVPDRRRNPGTRAFRTSIRIAVPDTSVRRPTRVIRSKHQ